MSEERPDRRLIPVILRFNQIAGNANINLSFTTPGVRWCLGPHSADSLGFSYNVMNTDETTANCIQQIEFNNAVLSIRTASSAPAFNDFSLTLYLHVDPDVHALQGTCTLNNEAQVIANFGSERAVQWRNGRISAALRTDFDEKYRSILFAIKGLVPSSNIELEIGTDSRLGEVSWSLGQNLADTGGIQLSSSEATLPLSFISYGRRHITLETAATLSSTSIDFSLLAYVFCEPLKTERRLEYIYLKAGGNSNVAVYAQVGSHQPQLVSDTFTLFSL